jgi:hypothetical protein
MMIDIFEGRPVAFDPSEAPGAWPNGTKVRKANSEPGDGHRDGALAVVRGSVGPDPRWGYFGYFVEWDDLPGVPVFIASPRLEKYVTPIPFPDRAEGSR